MACLRSYAIGDVYSCSFSVALLVSWICSDSVSQAELVGIHQIPLETLPALDQALSCVWITRTGENNVG